jgi:hypothetical protein
MKTRSYLVLCACVTAAWVVALLSIPAFAESIEQLLLLFLSTNAR